MKPTKYIFFIFLMNLIIACEKEEASVFDDLEPKPNGKYLTEITWFKLSDIDPDTLNYAKLEYNSKRYLTKIQFDVDRPDSPRDYLLFSYNESGKISKIQKYNNENVLVREEIMTYEKDTIMYKESHWLNSETEVWEYGSKSLFIFDSLGKPVKRYSLDQDDEIDSIQSPRALYFYDKRGNLTEYYDSVINPRETILYKYDTKVNPFNSICFDFFNSWKPWTGFISYIPNNNLISEQYGMAIYTYEYFYEDNYPTYCIVNRAKWFFHYTDL